MRQYAHPDKFKFNLADYEMTLCRDVL